MTWRHFRRVFMLDTGRPDIEGEIDQELEFHIQSSIAELVARGMDEASARAEAERRFGSVTRTRATLREIDAERVEWTRRAERLAAGWQDVRMAVRGLVREPGFALTVAVTLALGIGANATMVGLVDRLLFRPPAHVVDPDRVAQLSLTQVHPTFGSFTNTGLAWPDYVLTREIDRFSDAAAFYTVQLTLGHGLEAERVRVTMATANFFPLLGVRPSLGRFYGEDEDRIAGAPVVVLGERFWKRRFGGDPAVLGTSLRLGGTVFTVIGIAPRGFTGIELNAIDAWIPVGPGAPEVLGPSGEWRNTRNWQWVRVITRLAPGVEREAAAVALTTRYRAAIASDPEAIPNSTFNLHAIHAGAGPEAPRATRVARWLAAVSFVVLLIACANVANLLLARGARRQREIAVRLALGIRRRRLVAQLVLESLILAGFGGGLALLIARWGGDAIRVFLLPSIDWVDAPLDGRVIIVASLATLLTVLLAGLIPALRTSRIDLSQSLKSGAPGAGRDPRHTRLRRSLLVTQTALSVVLLVGAGLFVLSLRRVVGLDLGFEPRGLLVVDVDAGRGVDRARRAELHDRLEEAMRGFPGIRSVSQGIAIPFWTRYSTQLRLPGRDSVPRLPTGSPSYNGASPDFFATTGIRVLRGRAFTRADAAGGSPVMIVNQTMALTFWPGEEAIGRCVLIGSDSTPPCAEVVGVVEDSRREELREGPTMLYYVPITQSTGFGMSGDRVLFLRVAGRAEPMVEPVRRAILAAAPELPWANVRPMESLLEPQVQPWRLGASMFSVFGLLALAVAAVGLYGGMAYSVATRTREFGVRGALGATAGGIAGQVVREGVALSLVGLVIGAAIALGVAGFAAPLLFDTAPRDPVIFSGVAAVLLLVALLSSLIPALRAGRVAPIDALRAE